MTRDQALTLENLIKTAKNDESILALILVGSLSCGLEKATSDIDIYFIVTDNRFESLKPTKEYFWGLNLDPLEFPTPVDGKLVPKNFLEKICINGNESVHNTFKTAQLLVCKDNQIVDYVDKLHNWSLIDKEENIKKYYALMKSARFQADENIGNILFLHRCIFNTVFFACRLVLAHNDKLYPCAKGLYRALLQCPKIPDNFISLMEVTLKSDSLEQLIKFYDSIEGYFKEDSFNDNIRKGYVLENELFWYFNIKPFEEL